MPFKIEEKTWTHTGKVQVGATCGKCGQDLEALDSHYNDQTGASSCYKGALYVSLSGSGYGEFMDGDPGETEILCRKCANEFLSENPFLKRLLMEEENES